MCPDNMSNGFNILAYLDSTINNTYYFEYYMYQSKAISSEGFSIERLLNSQTQSFSVNTSNEVETLLLENYYYDIKITNKYCKSFLIDPKDNRLFYEDLSLDLPEPWYIINIAINHNVTKQVANRFVESKKLLEKLENLKKCLLKVYISGEIEEEYDSEYNSRYANSYGDWLDKKNENKEKLDIYLNKEAFEEGDVSGFDATIKSIIPNFNIDKRYRWDKLTNDDIETRNMLLEKCRDLRELLLKIRAYGNSAEQNDIDDLVGIYVQLLGFDGIGEVGMSILLNTINNKYFPIYSRGLSRYMKMVGFEIESDEILDKYEKNAVKYNNYQIGINQMFRSFGNYLNDHRDSYDAVNYYFRKKLDLFEL